MLGTLWAFWRTAAGPMGEEQVALLEELALRAGPAIENARRFQEARQLADMDALTGLHNYRFFHETLAREVARSHRYDRRLALVVFDVDDFKAVNDRVGHLAGDSVLAGAAHRVLSSVRSADIACRVGGDEFAVILPESSRSDAEALYERLESAIDRSTRRAPRSSGSPPASPSSGPTTTRRPSSSGPTRRSTARRHSARARRSRRAARPARTPPSTTSQERFSSSRSSNGEHVSPSRSWPSSQASCSSCSPVVPAPRWSSRFTVSTGRARA